MKTSKTTFKDVSVKPKWEGSNTSEAPVSVGTRAEFGDAAEGNHRFTAEAHPSAASQLQAPALRSRQL